MPLGDSITYGKVNKQLRDLGATELSYGNRLRLMKRNSTSGPDSLGDKDHEGHPGKTIDGLTLASRWLNIYTPDIVTLIIGTNDTGRGYSIKMSSDLSGLIDKITQQLPDAQLLASIRRLIQMDSLRHGFKRRLISMQPYQTSSMTR